MRAFAYGLDFMDVESEGFIPDEDRLVEMADDIARDGLYPTFSEGHLYPRLGKEDARFVLGIAEEYTAIIKALGVAKVREILNHGR